MNKLKPCPFCNGNALIIYGVSTDVVYIECTKCNAQMGTRKKSWSALKGELSFETEEEAVKAWNRREGK